MANTTYTMQRANTGRWSLVAVRGGCRTLVDESGPQTGVKRARLDFERRHGITVETIEAHAMGGHPETERLLRREAEALSLDLSGVEDRIGMLPPNEDSKDRIGMIGPKV